MFVKSCIQDVSFINDVVVAALVVVNFEHVSLAIVNDVVDILVYLHFGQ